MLLTREQILTSDDIEIREVPVPAWGGSVYVRTLTLAEHMQLAGKSSAGAILAACCCDAEGVRMFSDDDAAGLEGKSGAAIAPIIEAACEINGFDDDDIEQIAGN